MKAAVGTVKPGVVASSARLENGLNIDVRPGQALQGHVWMQNGYPVLASTTTKAVVSELKQETNKDKLKIFQPSYDQKIQSISIKTITRFPSLKLTYSASQPKWEGSAT